MNINLDNLNLNLKIIFIRIINNNKIVREIFLYFIKTINDRFIKIIKIINNEHFKFIKTIKKTFIFFY